MKQTVLKFIKEHRLLDNASTIIVGVSGGPDSLALLHLFWDLRTSHKFTLVCAHVDHMFRGEESYEDYNFVERFCKKRQIVFEGARIDVNSYQKEHGISAQMAARECRYHFFQEIMEKHDGDCLALGHHGDDQIETMIMKMVRGSHGYGLAGIPVSRPFATGKIIRPFLGITKDQIEQYCKEALLEPRIDKSNFTDKYTRNRIRQNVLPILKAENPSVHDHFQRYSEWITEDETFLESLVEEKMVKVVEKLDSHHAKLLVNEFCQVAIPLQRRMIHLILKYLYGKNYLSLVTAVHIQAIIHLITSNKTTNEFHLPNGMVVVRTYEHCLFFSRPNQVQHFCENLSIPGMIQLQMGKISGEVLDEYPSNIPKKLTYVCDLDRVKLPLVVRSRKDGDRISLVGTNGRKKVNRLFIDHKVSKGLRDVWPIVIDQNDTVVWVPLLAKSDLVTVTETTKKYLALSFQLNNDIDFAAGVLGG